MKMGATIFFDYFVRFWTKFGAKMSSCINNTSDHQSLLLHNKDPMQAIQSWANTVRDSERETGERTHTPSRIGHSMKTIHGHFFTKRFNFEVNPCVFCMTEHETTEHLFFSCTVTMMFWKDVYRWLNIGINDSLFNKFQVMIYMDGLSKKVSKMVYKMKYIM